ncbi:GNAT family N-acetyltransferase [Streptomyces sp. NPDC101171]|uniref:GNAT family N-acetyltransferase n=1 Tax=Streptomyces sp. NPDC101171 TaxID=3366122 RepID=UPI00381C908D
MRAMSGDDVLKAVDGCLAALGPVAGRDWEGVRAAGLEWSCRETVEHIAGDLIAYAGQLAGRPQDSYVPFEIRLDDGTDNAGLLDVVRATGALLDAAVRTTPPHVRAFHPYPFRSADRQGFAAMGVAEVVLHTHDVTRALGVEYTPEDGLAEAVLGWLFPHVQPGPAAWPTLLWATGRGALPGRAPVTEWRWRNNLVIPAERIDLVGLRPVVARDIRLGGDGGLDWIEGGPYEGTREAAGFLVKAYEGGVHRPEFGVFALVRKEDGRAVGGIGFHSAPDEDGRVEIGYDLVEGARGQGYITEAVRALADWALARDDVHALFATVERENTASQAVLGRAGFTRVNEEDGSGAELAYELRR